MRKEGRGPTERVGGLKRVRRGLCECGWGRINYMGGAKKGTHFERFQPRGMCGGGL